jgi:hypothetical protein
MFLRPLDSVGKVNIKTMSRPRTYPIISNFVRPNQFAIEAEVDPFRDLACPCLQGSGVPIVCVDAVWAGGRIGVVGPGRGGPVQAVPPVWVIYGH